MISLEKVNRGAAILLVALIVLIIYLETCRGSVLKKSFTHSLIIKTNTIA